MKTGLLEQKLMIKSDSAIVTKRGPLFNLVALHHLERYETQWKSPNLLSSIMEHHG